jgi:hypothetical protein
MFEGRIGYIGAAPPVVEFVEMILAPYIFTLVPGEGSLLRAAHRLPAAAPGVVRGGRNA